LSIAFDTRQAVMLHGRHGIGKSAIFHAVAERLRIDCCVRDLSIMEPPDLAGMPYIEQGRTHFAAPSFLPQAGCGLLVFEELNRTRRDVITPTLQLLSARRLNDYMLPPGWLPCAAVNDSEDGYDVETLD